MIIFIGDILMTMMLGCEDDNDDDEFGYSVDDDGQRDLGPLLFAAQVQPSQSFCWK